MSWRFAAAKTQGTSHVRNALPSQDAFSCSLVSSEVGPVLVAVVSDGAGSASHGEDGAHLICSELSRTIEATLGDVVHFDADRWLAGNVERVRRVLLDEAERRELMPRQMAATLLCAVVAPDWSAFAQLGDGAIVTSEPGTGEWSWLFWPHRGEYANMTTFLTDPTAMEMLDVETTPRGAQEIALFTDGIQHLVLNYAEQSVHSPFFEQIIRPVRLSKAEGEDAELSEQLAAYLTCESVTSRADDDLTLVLASRCPLENHYAAPC